MRPCNLRVACGAVAALVALGGCAASVTVNENGARDDTGAGRAAANGPLVTVDPDPFPSTYRPLASEPTAIVGATILDGKGGRIDNGYVVMSGGDVRAIGAGTLRPEPGVRVIDAAGKWVTAGIIDIHSHLGVYPSPSVRAHQDGNEISAPVTAEVWAEHGIWPQDPGFGRALAGGVTSLMVLPGSANLFGGRTVTLKNVPGRTVQAMKFPDAPYGLKMACGENPKRVYGAQRKRAPASRMGNVAGYRQAWARAVEYKRAWDAYADKHASGKKAKPPKRDLELDTLKGVLEGDILVHMHCYRADEMAIMIDVSREFDYHIGTFHHAVESYKIADLLAANGTCSAMWADWWGFKMEAYDTIRENIPFVHDAGACAIVHSDSDVGIQRLNQEAAKALADGRKAGLDISKAEAWAWLSLNPARAMGIDGATGSLEPGKDADVVIWSSDPFSVYAKAEQVFVDGALMWHIDDARHQPVMDFELGQPGEGDAK